MANRSIPWISNLALNLLAIASIAQGQPAQLNPTDAIIAAGYSSGGLRTDRLTSGQLRVWRSIEQVAMAVDGHGQPLHPRLHGLWLWARTSRQPIRIELQDRKDPSIYHAGTVDLETAGPEGQEQLVVIRLYLCIIEEAATEKEVQRADGFIPFKGLRKTERYAQVLGHELAHAALMLQDPEYARLCKELDKEKAEFLLARRQSPAVAPYDDATRLRLARLQALTNEIEAPAHATEVEIWRELLEGQRARK